MKSGKNLKTRYRQLLQRVRILKKSLKSYQDHQLTETDKLQARLSNAITIANLGYWEYDVDNDILIFDDLFYKMLRTTAEKVGGYRMKSAEYANRFVHPDEFDIVKDETRKAIETNDPHYRRQLEHRIIYGDGTVGYIKVRIFIKKDENGRTVNTYGINQDITEQKESEKVLHNYAAELETRNKEIRELAHKTIQAMENDRRGFAKELHDSIGGTLAAIRYQLEDRIEQSGPPPPSIIFPLEKVIKYIDQAIQESRRITNQLRPSVLDDFGLVAAIEEHIKDFQEFYPKVSILKRIYINEDELSNDTKTVIYRVLQESLNNVGKHSNADAVIIQCDYHGKFVKLQVKDNGIGFKPSSVIQSTNVMEGYGIYSMKERVDLCDGIFIIESEIGKGSNIAAYLPIAKK